MRISGFGQTDIGKTRELNEDLFFVDDTLGLYIVCDGMGGHAAGQVASETAVNAIVSFIRERESILKDARAQGQSSTHLPALVSDAIQHACRAVYGFTSSDQSLRGMGTTATLLLVYGQRAVVGHVGDSRLYLLRGGTVHRLTHDHTLVQDMIDRGSLAPEARGTFAYSHVLSRAVGVMESVQVETLHFDILPGDTFLLCSDGLTEVVTDQELGQLLLQKPISLTPSKLIELALAKRSSDNITTVVIEAQAEESEMMAQRERSDEVMLKIGTLERMYLFRSLQLQEIVRFVDKSVIITLPRGEYLFREGATDNSLYVILNGKLQVESGEIVMAELGEGNHVGEMAWLSGATRSAAVRAIEDCRLLRIAGDDFEGLVYEDPVIGVRLLREVSRELAIRLRQSNKLLQAL